MEETISLQEILKIIKKRLLLIISLVIISIGIAVTLNLYFIVPIYQVKTQILVNQSSNTEESWSRNETDLQLIDTYNEIITSPIILNKVIEQLKLDIEPEQLANQIILSSRSNSKVVNILVENENPEQAVNIANTTAEVFKEEIPSLMNVDNINILSAAKLSENPSPVKPNKMLNIAIGAVIGIILGVGLAFLLEIFDTTIKDEKDVEEILGIPIMGIVGSIPLEKEKKRSSSKSRKVRGELDAGIEK